MQYNLDFRACNFQKLTCGIMWFSGLDAGSALRNSLYLSWAFSDNFSICFSSWGNHVLTKWMFWKWQRHKDRIFKNHKICRYITSDALKIEPNRMCPCAFITTFWQFFDFILQISHDKTFTYSLKKTRAGFLRRCQISLCQISPEMIRFQAWKKNILTNIMP